VRGRKGEKLGVFQDRVFIKIFEPQLEEDAKVKSLTKRRNS
jgi:hypothetical protein